MRRALLGVAAIAALAAGPAVAADLRARPAPVYKSPPPVAPSFTWTGCYVGGNVGGAWAYKRESDPTRLVRPFLPGQDLGSHAAGGFIGGGQVGCDYQVGSWVIGAQGMFDWTDLKGDNLQPNGAFFNNTHIPWLTTATGRLGYTATPNLLIYAKGGGAWVRDNYSSYTPAGLQVASATVTRSGWTVRRRRRAELRGRLVLVRRIRLPQLRNEHRNLRDQHRANRSLPDRCAAGHADVRGGHQLSLRSQPLLINEERPRDLCGLSLSALFDAKSLRQRDHPCDGAHEAGARLKSGELVTGNLRLVSIEYGEVE